MDNGYATLRCALTVHPGCDACKKHTMEILGSIIGTYDISLDAERSLATIVGQVDPNYCIRAIGRCDGHAELVWANLSHPKIRGTSLYDYDSSSYYDYSHRLPWHDRNIPEYSFARDNIDYEYSLRRRDPYYSRNDYTIPYHNEEPMNLCNIL